MNILSVFLDLLYPSKCILCGRLLEAGEQDLCKLCRLEVPAAETGGKRYPYLADWTAVWYYEDSVRDSIRRYKFKGAKYYAQGYGRSLSMEILRKFPEGFDVLTWVPVSRKRLRKRGYDQAQLLAKAVGREIGLAPIAALKKIRNNPAQSGLSDGKERKRNVQGVYTVRKAPAVAGKRVLLLDDVITTGATAGECARILLEAGAKEVFCAAVAYARGHTKNVGD